MKHITHVVALAALLGTALQADVIVDFETAPSGVYSPGQSFDTQGFTFTEGDNGKNSGAFAFVPLTANSCTPSCVSDGTKTLGAFNSSLINMALAGGGTFDLSSFDLAGTFTAPDDGRNVTLMEVDGFLSGGGTVSAQFNVSPDTFATFTLPNTFVGLVGVNFFGLQDLNGDTGKYSGPEFQLDNIDNKNLNAVPEPASTLPLLLLGGLGLAWRQKRSRRVSE
jgi:hypothetical protein